MALLSPVDRLRVRARRVVRTVYGRPKSYQGSHVRIPVGTSRVMVKAHRNDIEAAPADNVTDSLQIQVAYTPRGLVVPR